MMKEKTAIAALKHLTLILVTAGLFPGGKVTVLAKEWYETTSIYEVYPRSLKDSNGDGVGDIRGIIEKLYYFEDLEVETLWIQPFYKSPMLDFGYDISDFKAVEPVFGTIEDFKELINSAHSRGMKIMIDLVPNHASTESVWFKKSVKGEGMYKDFFVWRSGVYDQRKGEYKPPNNWLSVFGGSAWKWNDERKQFYLHQFSEAQPDLDFRNPIVRSAMEDIIRFWLDIGVDGFRVDAIVHLVEDERMRDNLWVTPDKAGSLNYFDQLHTYSEDQPETYEITHSWRMLLEEYKIRDNRSRVLAIETYQPFDKMKRFYGNETYKNVNFPISAFYPGFFAGYTTDAEFLNAQISQIVDGVPPYGTPCWGVSNHDVARVASRSAVDLVEGVYMIELLLPGAATVYYGDEIRMQDFNILPHRIRDPTYKEGLSVYLRDMARTPMQWDDSNNAGFTTKKESWLPVNSEYWRNNVKQQLQDPKSPLKTFKRLLKLRNTPVIKNGELKTCVISSWLYLFERRHPGEQSIFVLVNLGTELETVCITDCTTIRLPQATQVHTSSLNSGYDIGDIFTVQESEGNPCSTLRPYAGLVLTEPIASGNFGVRPSLSLLIWILPLITLIYSTCRLSK